MDTTGETETSPAGDDASLSVTETAASANLDAERDTGKENEVGKDLETVIGVTETNGNANSGAEPNGGTGNGPKRGLTANGPDCLAENGLEKGVLTIEPPPEPPEYPEEGWRAWGAVYSLFVAQCFALGVPTSWGVYQRTLLLDDTFPGATVFQLSFVGTISIGFLPATGIFTGALADMVPTRWLFLGGSLGMSAALVCDSFATEVWNLYCSRTLFGISAAFCIMPGTASLATWWSKRRALAMGIALSGTGVGGFLLNAVSQGCISAGGWRLGLRVCAAMCFAMQVPGALFIERRIKVTKENRRKGPFLNFKSFKNPTFSLLFFISFVFIFGFFTPSLFIPLMMSDGGYSDGAGAAIVAMFSALMAVGRILGGFITPRVGEVNMLLLGLFIPGFMGLTVWMAAPTNIITTSITAVIWGFWGGTPLVTTPVLVAKEFGTAGLGSVIGLLYISFAPGQLLGPSLSGIIVDKNTYYAADGTRLGANYRPLLAFTVATWWAALCLAIALRWTKVGWKAKVKI